MNEKLVSQTKKKVNKIWHVIFASSAGTMIEWYDFYIFGSLATIISKQFYPASNTPVTNLLITLATFATGFIIRPFGAIIFGRIGDLVGRKYTFLLTLLLMGGATFVIGLLPNYQSIGLAAPIILVLLRLLQGLALGGEYGGAATYVAEHSPDNKRGYYTSFIQTTATLGLFVSLGVILATRLSLGEEAFSDWGWRIPFLLSAILVVMSYYIRVSLEESPLFAKLKAEGKISKNPLKESFGNKENLRLVLLALFGATAGQGVVWYTGQFYALSFIQNTLKVDLVTSSTIVAIALLFGTPFFIYFGRLSDKIGRKKIMMAGCLIAALSYIPIYMAMYQLVDYQKKEIVSKNELKKEDGTLIQNTLFEDGSKVETISKALQDEKGNTRQEIKTVVIINNFTMVALSFWVFIQVIFVTMVYGPIAAYLVELFPTKIRYTSMSLPYHIGNGVFGGLTPFIATALTAATGYIYAGLLYPIGVALLTFVIGSIYIKDTRNQIDS